MYLLKKHTYLFPVFFLLLISPGVVAQDINIVLGPDEIGENQAFTITITINNERLRSYDKFPDIEGFRKQGTSSSSSTQIINGQISTSQSITMTYIPTKQGVYTLKPFVVTVNDKEITSEGKTIQVGPPVQAKRSDPYRNLFDRDPFEEFFGKKENPEFIDIKEDAFLALRADKEDVYVGEGVTMNLSFYVSDNNRAPLQFYELGKQLSEILKKIRPSNCWEENFNIENINGESITINGKGYTQYKIYEATFYPFNQEPIEFPSVGLKMIKYKISKSPSFFGRERQEDYKTFYSKVKTISVKELPPHPLKEAIPVGVYKLDEEIHNGNQLETGQSFQYDFNIYGKGNIASIEKPIVSDVNEFDFYSPNITQKINRKNGTVSGIKSFSYYGIPHEPGRYPFNKYFRWIFFNPEQERYDTLQSQYVVTVKGESKVNENILATDLGSFYDKIETEDNTLSPSNRNDLFTLFTNIFILLIVVTSAIIILKK